MRQIILGGFPMKIVRVYSGSDGESHFEDVTPEELAEIVNQVGEGEVSLGIRRSPTFSDFHNAPRLQYVVNIQGIAEFETADGNKCRMVPGDVLIAEDIEGHGHIARSLGDETRISLAVPLKNKTRH